MVYDCFTFFNELDLLELRLNELDSVVDKFVLVEATKNHQGKEKPLYFSENKKRFDNFLYKIIHVVVDSYPSNPENDAWVIERHQRSSIMNGLKDCVPDDVILVSDIDEIPRCSRVKEFIPKPGTKIFMQGMYYYYLNYMNSTDLEGGKKKYSWAGTVMSSYNKMKDPQDLRDLSISFLPINHPNVLVRTYLKTKLLIKKASKNVTVIDDGGWHFSYMGGVQRVIKKLESFAHSEYNKPEFKDPGKIENAIREGKDIFGRDFIYRLVEIDETYPGYLLKNRNKFGSYIISNK